MSSVATGSIPVPLPANPDGPYAYELSSGSTYIYARLTLSDPPNEWPGAGYYSAWVGKKGTDDPEAMGGLYRDWEEQPYRFQRSDFADDGSESVNAHLGGQRQIENTTFECFLRSPENEEVVSIGEITYGGSPEQRTLEPKPT